MTTSFWLDQPREGWAKFCCDKFGVTFNAPNFLVRSEFLALGPKKRRIAQVVNDTHRERGIVSSRKSMDRVRSQRAIDAGGSLIAGGR